MNLFGNRWLTLVASLILATQAVSAYDLATESSFANNPNGGWSYGYQTSLNGNFTALPVAVGQQSQLPG